MAIPTSATFDILDWNSRAGSTSDLNDALVTSLSDGMLQAGVVETSTFIGRRVVNQAEGLLFEVDASRIQTLSPLTAAWRYALNVPETFTFEVDFYPTRDIPEDFSSVNNRIFLGCVNKQGFTAGVLVSKLGLALARSPASPSSDIVVLQGSSRYFLNADGTWPTSDSGSREPVTIRLVVRQDDGRIEVYITQAGVAYEDPAAVYGAHELRYNQPALSSSLDLDQVLIASHALGYDHGLIIKSLRLATGAVDSPNKPTVRVRPVSRVTIGQRTRLDARSSFDPEGNTLTYYWDILERPKGSTTQLRGGAYPSAVSGSVVGDNELTFSHKEQSSRRDGFIVDIVALPNASPLKLEKLPGDHVVITLETGGLGSIQTNARELVEALTDDSTEAYNSEVSAVLTATLSSGLLGLGSVAAGRITLSGGIGSSEGLTAFVADKPGQYRLSLRVHNGSLFSDPEILSIFAAADSQLFRHRPNMDYVWRTLGDHWNLMQDKAKIDVAWSAAAQIISNELLQVWQRDYAKSISTITRRFQRRWLDYQLLIDVPETLAVTLEAAPFQTAFISPDASKILAATDASAFSTLSNSGTLVDSVDPASNVLTAGFSVNDPAVIVNQGGQIVKTRISDSVVNGASRTLRLSSDALNALEVITQGNYGFFREDPNGLGASLFTVKGERLPTGDVEVGDYLVIQLTDSVGVFPVTSTSPTDTTGAEPVILRQVLEVSGAVTVDGSLRKWQVVRPVSADVVAQVHQQPYFSFNAFTDLRPSEFQFGDAVLVSLPSPIDGQMIEVQLPILHVSRREVFPDWRPLLQEMNTLQALRGHSDYSFNDIWPQINLSRLVGFYRTERVPLVEEIESIPLLGSTTSVAELTENSDYTVSKGELRILPTNQITVDVQAGSNVVVSHTPLETGSLLTLVMETGEIGVYTIIDVFDGNKRVRVNHTFSYTGTYRARTPRYSTAGTIPDRLWGEVSYFNNDQTISDNFGVLVGLPKELVESSGMDVDYLSIVKACWVALMKGPQVNSLKMAAEAFLGLPYTEEAGVITVISEQDSLKSGRIIVKTPNQGGYRTYYYPTGYALGVNPSTGRTFQSVTLKQAAEWVRTSEEQKRLQLLIADSNVPEEVVETVDGETTVRRLKDEYRLELTRAQRVDDATVDAYVPLLSAVKVYDYVSNPTDVNNIFTGQDFLTRYHTFVVELPTKSLYDQSYDDLLLTFAREWKPARTEVLLLGAYPLEDQIDVTTDTTFKPTLFLSDAPHSSPVVKTSDTATAESQLPYTYPWQKTLDNLWLADTARDVYDKYESGYVEGRVSDFSGDGSWNENQALVDMVNQANADIDVLASYLWLPIEKTSTGDEFTLGEEVRLYHSGDFQDASVGWDSAPPVIVHIGSGQHPKIPFGVYNPQDSHPHTFLLLGFYQADGTGNYGYEQRLMFGDALSGIANVEVRGATSLAVGVVQTVRGAAANTYPTLAAARDTFHADHALHAPYFQLEYIFDTDKGLLWGPHLETHLQATQYVPVGGAAISTLEASLEPAVNDLQVQVHPYDPAVPDDEQKVPSQSPGFFSNWDNKVAGDDIVYGWTDVGAVSATPTTVFDAPASSLALQNLHIGKRARAWTERHVTHGWTSFVIPKPFIQLASMSSLSSVRVEGYYFVAPDVTNTGTLSSSASSFNGTVGGSWVFFRDQATSVEYSAVGVTFETGTSAGRTVLGLDGSTQDSTGHVLDAQLPTGMPEGTYTVIVRQYRPYEFNSGDPVAYHVDEHEMPDAFTLIYVGFGFEGFGTGGFGGS